MAVVGAPETLAQGFEIDVETKLTFDMACKIVLGHGKIQKLTVPQSTPIDSPSGATTFLSLPLKQTDHRATKISHLVEVIKDYEGELNYEEILAHMKQGNYGQLPEPVKPKKPIVIGYVMDLCFLKTEKGVDILKHYVFEQPTDVKVLAQITTGASTSHAQF